MTKTIMERIAGELKTIPLEQLEPSRKNPRRTMNVADLWELAASIREHGIQVPLLVRPTVWSDAGAQEYEIVAGHRRCEAATLAGLDEVPCIVREMSDEEAAEIALIDNLQRVDVPALEEAEALGELLELHGSVQAVAAKVGKEQAYVAKSLKLRALTDQSRTALTEGLITVDHARLLARLAEAEQNAALKWCLDTQAGVKVSVDDVIAHRLNRRNAAVDEGDDEDGEASRRPRWRREWEPQSAQRLKEHIECESGVPLDRAPWPMEEDWLLPDVGSCLDCEKNTKANVPLFGDLDMGVAVCTDGGCFKAKTVAFVQIRLNYAPFALKVSWKSTSTAPRQEKDGSGPSLTQTFKAGQWIEATKRCETSRVAVTVDWSDANNRGHMGVGGELRKPGEILQACIEPKCKVHAKAYEKVARSRGGGAGAERESWEDREKREAAELEAFAKEEGPVRRALYDAIAAKLSSDQLKRLLLEDNPDEGALLLGVGIVEDDWQKRAKRAQAVIAEAKTSAALDRLLFHNAFGYELGIDHSDIAAKDKGRGKLRELAKVAGVDAAAIERQASQPEKQKPTPAKAAKAPKPKAPAKKAAKKSGKRR